MDIFFPLWWDLRSNRGTGDLRSVHDLKSGDDGSRDGGVVIFSLAVEKNGCTCRGSRIRTSLDSLDSKIPKKMANTFSKANLFFFGRILDLFFVGDRLQIRDPWDSSIHHHHHHSPSFGSQYLWSTHFFPFIKIWHP